MKGKYLLFIFIILLSLLLRGFAIQQNSLEDTNLISCILKNYTNTTISYYLLNFFTPISILLLQLIIILSLARILGWLMGKIGQPTVIGEIIAGIALGPSLLGNIAPQFSAFLFSPDLLKGLHFLSQLGLILFMFIVGMELDLNKIKKELKNTIWISNSSIFIPFVMGIILAYYLYPNYSNKASLTHFALFMGISISITAFPILARILMERDLIKTPIGSIALTTAAANDITAWLMLAILLVIIKSGNLVDIIYAILFSFLFIIFMLFIIRPFLKKLSKYYFSKEILSKSVLTFIFLILLSSSFISEIIGIHALFGAFIAGITIPTTSKFKQLLTQKIEDISLVLLLPIFFVFTGLRTEITTLNNIELWKIFGIILLVATFGKFIGSSLSAKLVGINLKDSLILGTLMNSRGLMELVILNIGYDLNILSKEIFSILVLMALTTTFITGPILQFINYLFKSKQKEVGFNQNIVNILISFGNPKSGGKLLELAYKLFNNEKYKLNYTAIHYSPSADINIQDAKTFEKESFKNIQNTAKQFNIRLKTYYKTTIEVAREIVQFVNNNNFNFLLAGSSRSLFVSDITGGKVKYMFDNIKTNIGIFIDKGFKQMTNVLVIIDDLENNPLTILKTAGIEFNQNIKLKVLLKTLNNSMLFQEHFFNYEIINEDKYLSDNTANISKIDLIIISLSYWNKIKQEKNNLINPNISMLIVN